MQRFWGHFAALTTVQMILTNLAGPFWAALADRGTLEKKTILIVGCLGEGISATCFAFVPNFTMMMVVRAFSGFFLAALRPICNGIVADLTSENRRGKVFGRVQGALLCGMFVSDLIADTCFIMLYLAFAESDLFFLCELYPAKVGSFFSSVTSTLRGKHGESVLLAGRRPIGTSPAGASCSQQPVCCRWPWLFFWDSSCRNPHPSGRSGTSAVRWFFEINQSGMCYHCFTMPWRWISQTASGFKHLQISLVINPKWDGMVDDWRPLRLTQFRWLCWCLPGEACEFPHHCWTGHRRTPLNTDEIHHENQLNGYDMLRSYDESQPPVINTLH